MNFDNFTEEGSFLNAVNITSNVRAPGEYKYYYCGEKNSSSDKSFLSISTMWYTTKISEDMLLLSSCYNRLYTCLLYNDQKKNLYYIYIYQNLLDYKSENISLKPLQVIQLEHCFKPNENFIPGSNSDSTEHIVKIYLGADNYILLNEFDKRILLIDFFNGNYVTIFNNKDSKSQEPIYNLIDTYDENYYLEGELRVRTYAFLSIKNQEKKISYYKYKYFIVERGILENNFFFLHSIDLDLGNAEPYNLKIVKIPKQSSAGPGEDKSPQWFYIFCFLSSQKIFQLITNYDRLTLYQMLRNINQCNTINVPFQDNKAGGKIKSSIITIGLRKEPLKKKIEENKTDNNKLNNNENFTGFKNVKQICFWSTSISLSFEKKQVAQSIKIFININTKRLCGLIIFFEIGTVISFPFNYNDTPEEIKNKITIAIQEILIDKLGKGEKSDKILLGNFAKVYKFNEHYIFKSKTICAFTSKNLILGINNHFRIYDLENTCDALYTYHFYKENIESFLLFEDIGATFLLTWNKIFKVIFDRRYKIFSENEFKNNQKYQKNPYLQESLYYPIFEDSPEDIWNSYCNKLEIETNEHKKYSYRENKNNSNANPLNNNSTNNSSKNIENASKKKECEICSKEAKYYCSDCEQKYYCSNEHFKYDYNKIHFFECQFVQFFKRKDIMSIENKEVRYMVLYNELIKLCGRILNFMFSRIFVEKDCHVFLEGLLNLITLLDNFGFYTNFSEFCSCNLIPSPDKPKCKQEKILFYQECIYFYVQLQILKCTFTLKCKLYNLTDCYLKIIKTDIIPRLTPKSKRKIFSLRCEKLKKELLFNNEYFQFFQSPVFFDLKKVYYNAECSDYLDIVESYILKHLMSLSILVKFKIKLHSSIDVKDIFTDISLMFEDHFREIKTCKNVTSYCYFSISFYLVEIGKVPQAVKLLKKMASSFNEKSDNNLKSLTYYNLGILQYALGEFKIGIHNIEGAYKLIVENFLSEKFKHKVMISLGLAYLNQRNLFKAYVLIQACIRELKKIRKQKYELKCIKLNVYLNYIIDLYEYSFITKARLQTNKTKKDKNYSIHQLINFVQGEKDKELIVIEQHVTEFLKVVEYIWNLPSHILETLQTDNPKKTTINYREEVHHEKNLSFTLEKSQMSTFLLKETGLEKEENQEEYDEDIEVKPTLFDSLTRQQQKDFKELKTVFLKRDIILRDSLGIIEKFNINYDPVYSVQFQKIIEKLKSNFLLKDIFYCFQNEKWRDELYNYSPNSLLFGLSKYLKLEKIKNVIAIEKSKCLDIIKKEKNDLSKDRQSINQAFAETDLLKKINIENNIYPNNTLQNNYSNNYPIQNINTNLSLFSRYKNEEMNYLQFKKKFSEALKENEKNKNDDKFQFYNLKDDYLISLYKNVYLNNPEHDFIFQNPSLILNYIFIDISNNDNLKKEANDLIMRQKIKEDENKIKERKSSSFMGSKNYQEYAKEEENSNNKLNIRFSSTFKRSSTSLNQNRTKEIQDIFDKKSKMIISTILENKLDINKSNKSSSEISGIENYIYLKFDIIEDNLTISRKVCELSFLFHRKKIRSVTSSWAYKYAPAFGKKKKSERKSCIPDLFLRFSNAKFYTRKETSKKLLLNNINENTKNINPASPLRPGKKNSKENKNSDTNSVKKRKKKKEKSCANLHGRISMNNNIGIDESKLQNNDNIILSSESLDMSKSSNFDNNQIQNSIKEISNEKEESNTDLDKFIVKNNDNANKPINRFNSTRIRNPNKLINENVDFKFRNKKTSYNNIIFNYNFNEKGINEANNNNYNKNDNNDNFLKKKSTINIKKTINNKNTIKSKKTFNNKNENNLIIEEIENNLIKGEIKNEKKLINKNPEFFRNESAIQLNNKNLALILNNDKNYHNKRKNKSIMINTKKSIIKPKTFNFFSPENLNHEEEEDNNINNFYANKKICFFSTSQKKLNKKYGFKNKKEQENEIINGALEYLQNEFNNKNKGNIKSNQIFQNSRKNMESLIYKYRMNENQINNKNKNYYKVPYDYKKKGKKFGEENEISLNSTSSGFYINNDYSYYDDENNFEKEKKRIINFNKKMKGKYFKNNCLVNIKLKKSASQPIFYSKNQLKDLENNDKLLYLKEKSQEKLNVYNKPISNMYNNIISETTNAGMSTCKNKLNGNHINSFNNINYSKFNIRSSQNKIVKMTNSNISLNKENKQKNYGDFFQDKQKNYKEEGKKENENGDNQDNNKNNTKFRFVLDKYLKKKKSKHPKIPLKEENNEEKKEEDNQNNYLIKDENFCVINDKEKEINDNEKKEIKNDFSDNLNEEKEPIINIRRSQRIDRNKYNKILHDKNFNNLLDEKLNISSLKYNQDSILYSNKNSSEIIYENNYNNSKDNIYIGNNLNKENIKNIKDNCLEKHFDYNLLNKNNEIIYDNIKNSSDDKSLESSSFNKLLDEMDIRNKINLPANYSPMIKNCNKKNINSKETNNEGLNESLNNSKRENNAKKKNINSIENIMNQKHDKPKKINLIKKSNI